MSAVLTVLQKCDSSSIKNQISVVSASPPVGNVNSNVLLKAESMWNREETYVFMEVALQGLNRELILVWTLWVKAINSFDQVYTADAPTFGCAGVERRDSYGV